MRHSLLGRRSGWSAVFGLAVVIGLVGAASPASPYSPTVAAQRAADLATFPAEVHSVGNLECPSAAVCVGTAYTRDDEEVLVRGTNGSTTWDVTRPPAAAGQETTILGLDCVSDAFCYAWGQTTAPTVWWTTNPAQGGWQAKVFDAGAFIDTMTCNAPAICVVATTTGSEVTESTGLAWFTADINAGAWTAQPMNEAYRIFSLTCPSTSVCVATGQGESYPGSGRVAPTIWSTADAATGGWVETQPGIDGTPTPSNIKSMQCFGVSLCIANGQGLYSSGLLDQFYSGYWVSTAPTTGEWLWHYDVGSPFERGPLSCASATICLSWDGVTMSSDPTPTDYEPGTPLALPIENGANLGDFDCLDADHCFAWGSDSGSASLGPLLNTRLWRGSSLGGAWSVAPLPTLPGYAERVPRGNVACNLNGCTAVGGLYTQDFYDMVGPVVWVTNPDGSWRVVAAPPEVTGDDEPGDGAGGAKVSTKVALKAKSRRGKPDLLVGRLTADRGCASSRTVTLVGKSGKSAKGTRSTHQGRFTIVLTNRVLAKLDRKARVGVVRMEKGQITCLAAKSKRVRIP